MQDEREDKTIYEVVVNHEDQYSIWPQRGGLAYINEVWTDMRPLSLRKKMEEMQRSSEY